MMLLLNVNMDIAFDIVQIIISNATCPVVALVVPTVLRTRILLRNTPNFWKKEVLRHGRVQPFSIFHWDSLRCQNFGHGLRLVKKCCIEKRSWKKYREDRFGGSQRQKMLYRLAPKKTELGQSAWSCEWEKLCMRALFFFFFEKSFLGCCRSKNNNVVSS